MKYFVNKVAAVLMLSIFISGVSNTSFVADTECDNNGFFG